MNFLKEILSVIIGFSSGIVVAGGIFAFIAIIGVVPRMAQRTDTIKYIPVYEDVIMVGGILGSTTIFIDYYFPIGVVLAMIAAFSIGIFIGCLAVSLAEVINVIPIFTRRARLTQGIPLFITAIAVGKLVGSLLYFLVPAFYLNI